MDADFLRKLAAGMCGVMAAAIVLFQFVLTPGQAAPTFLFVLFTGLWLFGLAMLLLFPLFGAVGTTAWGILSAFGAWRTHEVMSPENAFLIFGSLAAAVLAAAYLVARRRAGASSA